jgi:NhaP-type Na+/H+ or K+/H+ antiporter
MVACSVCLSHLAAIVWPDVVPTIAILAVVWVGVVIGRLLFRFYRWVRREYGGDLLLLAVAVLAAGVAP